MVWPVPLVSQVGLETLLREIDKLTAVRQLGLPGGLFADASEKFVDAWRARAMRSYPSNLRAVRSPRHSAETAVALGWHTAMRKVSGRA
ncbi:hypothetical protein E1161_22820 [Saccharopolyspora aridisoli]|uniref:Uncharacterized protein n=1 Tax=Saccharopolyspora aridisoli TaxID=2530385 RepID=A0A4R4UFW1_9PSEU|nr:hypothetical protein E1161_22820 [Saccharopolyspora aridisoli]